MRIGIIAGESTEITQLLTAVTWSGNRTQAARRLDFTFLQDDRDANIPVVSAAVGYTVSGLDDAGNEVFRGNIYDFERDRANSTVKIVAFDNNFVLNKSKTTRKIENSRPEDVAKSICRELGVKIGNIAHTGLDVSFIANNKSGYEIICAAYGEAKKLSGKLYQCIMRGDFLHVIAKGELCGVTLDSSYNLTDSIFNESIQNLTNRVLITDTEGNPVDLIDDPDSISRYSLFQTVYRQQKDRDALSEAKALLNAPERSGTVTAIGDYRCITGYSLLVRDSNLSGKFWIKSDTHTFKSGLHTVKLTLEFENIVDEVKVEYAKN